MATGSIRVRENKNGRSYQITVEGDRDPLTGKRNRKYKTVRGTKKQAELVRRKMIEEMESGDIVVASAMKVKDWMEEWVSNYVPNIEATTRVGYNERIRNSINPYLGEIPLKTLKPLFVQKWVNTLHNERGLKPKTIKNAFLNLKAALDKAVLLGMIPRNPCIGVELPKMQKYQGKYYNKEELKIMLDAAKDTDIYMIVLLAAYVGFRRGELVALTWDDIDFEKKVISVRNNTVLADGNVITKQPKSVAGIRDITVGDNIIAELKKAQIEYKKRKLAMGRRFIDSNLVICREDGKGYRPDSITQKWRRFIISNNLKDIRFHDLRHSCATAMIEAGIDPKTVQQRMGHADISVTMNIYAHCTKTMDEKAAELMDNIIFA